MKNDDDGKRFLPWLCGMFSLLLFSSNSAKVLFLVYIHFDILLFSQFIPKNHVAILKPSLSMKILSINNFTNKLPSKLLSDLYCTVYNGITFE